ncbi:DUF58 domain-containing protein [Antrihabitans sp. NCIMB 15449]|uniref:DUF58 domain-containing protein n=1 Tax=Antrihabitans spumae TaxID=3373370 RepID=A0ABW7JLD2_9NOCA
MRTQLVVTGRAALVAAVGSIAVAVMAPSWLGVTVMTLLLLGAVGLDMSIAGNCRTVTITRSKFATVRLGRRVAVPLTIANGSAGRVRGTLWDDWQSSAGVVHRSHPIDLAPGQETRLDNEAEPVRRGDRLGSAVTLRVIGPLGLGGRQIRHTVDTTIRALPAFRSERQLPSRVRQLQHLEGRNIATVRGQGTEFDSYREYAIGDDVRSIDWRATARARDVVVRTWRPERNRHVLLILDTGRASAGRTIDGTRLDTCMEAALLLGGLASRAGDTVDLLAYDREVRAEVLGITGKRLQHRLMHAMAPLTPRLDETDCRGLVEAALLRTKRRSLVVWCTSIESGYPAADLLPAVRTLAHRHHVLMVSVGDPEVTALAGRRDDAAALYSAAAAERAIARRDLVGETLRRIGVKVVAAEPERLPAALADEYLELKRVGTM